MFGFGKKKSQSALKEAKNWYADRYQTVLLQRNFLGLITVLALAGLGATTYAVARIADSKSFEPYVIEVEKTSGIVTLVDRKSIERYSANEAVIRYYVHRYVTAREGYDVNTYQYDYGRVVPVLSDKDVLGRFRGQVSQQNPNSPVLQLGRERVREVFVKSIQFIEPNRVQVRIRIDEKNVRTGFVLKQAHRIAIVKFGFFTLELSTQQRYINPLGFRVLGYSLDEDTFIEEDDS